MNDTPTYEPDGYVVVHHRAGRTDGPEDYALGPFPPDLDLVHLVDSQTACSCERTVVPLFWPTGMRERMSNVRVIAIRVSDDDDEPTPKKELVN